MPENFNSELEKALPTIERLAKNAWKAHGGQLRQGPEMIEDLRSEGVVAFLKTMEQYDGRDGITPMQYTRARVCGAMIDFIKGHHSDEDSLDEPINGDDDARKVDLLTSGELDPEERLIYEEFRISVARAIIMVVQSLSERQQKIAKGLFEEGKDGKEVAEELGIGEKGVSWTRAVIIRRVRERLAKTADYKLLKNLPNSDVLKINKDGIARLPDGREAVHLPGYAKHIKWDYGTIRSAIKANGIISLKNYVGVYKSRRERHKMLYLKEAIDRITINVCQLDTNGIGTLPDGREVVCLEPYGKHLGVNRWSLQRKAHTRKIAPIPGVLGKLPYEGRQGRTVRIYQRKEIDALIKSVDFKSSL